MNGSSTSAWRLDGVDSEVGVDVGLVDVVERSLLTVLEEGEPLVPVGRRVDTHHATRSSQVVPQGLDACRSR